MVLNCHSFFPVWTSNARTRPFVFLMHPEPLAGGRIERDDRAARAARRIQASADHQRRAFELELRTRAEIVGPEAPRDLELVEVAGVDLIERRILRSLQIRG